MPWLSRSLRGPRRTKRVAVATAFVATAVATAAPAAQAAAPPPLRWAPPALDNPTVVQLSPTNRAHDLVKKATLYADFGVPEYWIADPDRRRMVINILKDKEYAPADQDDDGWLPSRVFPGLRVDPAEVFSGLG